MVRPVKVITVLSCIFPLTLGCDAASVEQFGCDVLEEEIVALSEGALIKIAHSKMVSRSADELVCDGIGIYSDRSEIKTRFRTYRDSEGDWMLEYDTDEAEAQAAELAQREFNSKWNEAEQELQSELRSAEEEANRAMEDALEAIRRAN